MGRLDATVSLEHTMSLEQLCQELLRLDWDDLHALIIGIDSGVAEDEFTGPLVEELNRGMVRPVYEED